ncbi:hypothetical protein CASFOL_023836 [Castilleja foliolosa]|uniref:Uncharacterized protein n=1 Tax=Castilleja foliolosa TaxID=1961234 RepID=A0ABD3CMP2_9LAMI
MTVDEGDRAGIHARRSSWGRKSGSWEMSPEFLALARPRAQRLRRQGDERQSHGRYPPIIMVVLGLFITWRICHPNNDAVWLWGMSVKNSKSDLPAIDMFVSRADPEKEPPLVTSNTILAAEYPVEKLVCYVSDDGGGLLTFEAMTEAASFANLWVPSCPTWMADGTHWPGTWLSPSAEHSKGDHAGIIQVMLKPPSDVPLCGTSDDSGVMGLTDVDIRLPMLVCVSREKCPGYDHNKKAGAMNSAIISNGAFILNLDCDHYIYNSEAMCEVLTRMIVTDVQFPQRFEFIDPSNSLRQSRNTVFFDGNMRALNGLQGPVYVGTGCLFRQGSPDPPRAKEHSAGFCSCCFGRKHKRFIRANEAHARAEDVWELKSAHIEGRVSRPTVAEAINVVSCWYEDKTEWGQRVGWIYGSVTEDVITGYQMHNRGWQSIYCLTKRDAFRWTAPINLTDRLHQILRWATVSVELFFSRKNAFLASSRMKVLQRIAYLNFIVQTLNVTFSIYLLTVTVTLCALAVLEIKWSRIELEEWWRNEQFWLIGGTNAHLAAVFQGILKVVVGV